MTSQIKNFVIGIHMPLETGGGGGVVQCHLANLLKNRGFNFVGSTIVYAHMQATGMVNDHLVDCFCYNK